MTGSQQLHFWSANDRQALPREDSRRCCAVPAFRGGQRRMSAVSRRTSFFALTNDADPDDGEAVERVEIPRFQRDYAQGRETDRVRRIRTDFLDALRHCPSGSGPQPRRSGLRLRRGRRRHAATARRPATPHDPVPAALVLRFASPAALDRSTGGPASPTPPGRAPGCSARAWSTTLCRMTDLAPSELDQGPALVPVPLAARSRRSSRCS